MKERKRKGKDPDVRSMQVHCDNVVAAGGREHVGYQPRAL